MTHKLLLVVLWVALATIAANIVAITLLTREVSQLKAKAKVTQSELKYANDRIGDLSRQDQSGWEPTANGGRKRVVRRRPSTGLLGIP